MKFNFSKLRFAKKFSFREKMILGAGVVSLALYLGIDRYVLPAYDTVGQYPDQITQRTRILRKSREVMAQRSTREQSLDSSRKQGMELESHLLNARTTAAAQAQLQSLVNDLAKQTTLQVNRSDFLPKKELGKDYEKVSVRLDTQGTINQITAFLAAAKGLPIFVFNDEMRVVNYNGLSDGFKKNKQISATLVVSGVIRHE